jgi:flagellar hook-basal body complex protein FliE
MKKIKVKMSWARATLLQQASFARGIVTAMTGNATFPTPAVTLTAMANAATRLETAWANRDNGAVARDELNNASTDLNDKLHTQAEYVDKIANGNDDIIHTAGFISTKPANERLSKVAAPMVATAPVIVSLAGGGIKVTVDAVAGAKVYCFILVLDGAFNVTLINNQLEVPTGTNALIINSTKRTATFKNLPAMKPVQVAVVTINSASVSGFSTVVNGSTIV